MQLLLLTPHKTAAAKVLNLPHIASHSGTGVLEQTPEASVWAIVWVIPPLELLFFWLLYRLDFLYSVVPAEFLNFIMPLTSVTTRQSVPLAQTPPEPDTSAYLVSQRHLQHKSKTEFMIFPILHT